MWSYYGSKSKVVHLYPKPKYGKIIEPFAGSARYSLRYFENDILLNDKNEVVIRIWRYLQSCSPGDILGLPKLKMGMDIRTLNISEDEKLFLGMQAGVASVRPRNKVSYFSSEQNGRKNKMKNIANQLYKIKHWKIIHGDYKDLKNEKATWFIDGPYQQGGASYIHHDIDYAQLSDWCKSRKGQIIVCENTKANWMDFKKMKSMKGAMTTTTEAIWSNEPTIYDAIQQNLF